jgi:hypothetical protein
MTGENRSTRRENCATDNFVHHKFQMGWPKFEPVPPLWKAGNRMSEACHDQRRREDGSD